MAEVAEEAAVASQKYAQQLQSIPEFSGYGAVLKSSPVVELSETEYVVSAVKHLFKEHLVLQFDIKNTLADYVLADVSVLCTVTSADEEASPLDDEFIIPASALKTDEPGVVYVSFSRPADKFVAASFTNVLKFTLKEIDPTTSEPEESGYEDEYQVEDLDFSGADYVLPAFSGSFDDIWN